MLDQLVVVTGTCEEDRRALFSIKERMETLSIAYKKQSTIQDFLQTRKNKQTNKKGTLQRAEVQLADKNLRTIGVR